MEPRVMDYKEGFYVFERFVVQWAPQKHVSRLHKLMKRISSYDQFIRKPIKFFFHIYPPFTRKRCIAMFWTVSPHSLGSCHFRVTCLPHKGEASR